MCGGCGRRSVHDHRRIGRIRDHGARHRRVHGQIPRLQLRPPVLRRQDPCLRSDVGPDQGRRHGERHQRVAAGRREDHRHRHRRLDQESDLGGVGVRLSRAGVSVARPPTPTANTRSRASPAANTRSNSPPRRTLRRITTTSRSAPNRRLSSSRPEPPRAPPTPRLQPSGQITGKVTDAASKKALGGATVCTAEGEDCVTTNEAGEYTLTGLGGGSYTVMFSATGYVSQYYKGKANASEATPVSVNSRCHDEGNQRPARARTEIRSRSASAVLRRSLIHRRTTDGQGTGETRIRGHSDEQRIGAGEGRKHHLRTGVRLSAHLAETGRSQGGRNRSRGGRLHAVGRQRRRNGQERGHGEGRRQRRDDRRSRSPGRRRSALRNRTARAGKRGNGLHQGAAARAGAADGGVRDARDEQRVGAGEGRKYSRRGRYRDVRPLRRNTRKSRSAKPGWWRPSVRTPSPSKEKRSRTRRS